MVQTLAITEAITTLVEAEQKFKLQRSEDPSFFPEWQQTLAPISALQKTEVEQLRRRYLYHRSSGPLLEETVKLPTVGPLLAVAGFYDPPLSCPSRGVHSIDL